MLARSANKCCTAVLLLQTTVVLRVILGVSSMQPITNASHASGQL